MLALDVNLKQSWRGEELLALVTLMELHVCEAHEGRGRGKGQKDGSPKLDSTRAGAGVMANAERHLPSAGPAPTMTR